MSNYLKRAIKLAIIMAAILGGIVYFLGFLGVGCVECVCGGNIAEAKYEGWTQTYQGIAIFAACAGAVYGFIWGLIKQSDENKYNTQKNMENWESNVVNKINHIDNLLVSNKNANTKIKECKDFINKREKWMSKAFIKEKVQPAMNKLEKVLFKSFYINSNVNGIYELERLINVLKARDTFKESQDYKKDIQRINELITYMREPSNMIQIDPYGKMKEEFTEKLKKYKSTKNELYNEIEESKKMIYGSIDKNLSILSKELFEKLEVALYFASRENPYNADRFNKIQKIYDNFKNEYINIQNYSRVDTIIFKAPDSIYTEIYTYKMMGETVLNNNKKAILEQVENRVSHNRKKELSIYIAAGLMNLGLYNIEKEILTYYVSHGIKVEENIQKRIKYLETDTRNGKIGVVHDVDTEGFAYDFASSNWSDDDIQAFFRNLAYQEKKLNYSLVIEDWKKTLPITGKIKISDEVICEKLSEMLDDEYDKEIICKVENTVALSESSFEEQKAIVFNSVSENYNKEITFVLSCIKVGKSLNIRIFTLFTPNPNKTTEEDLKEAVSIKKGLNPRNTAYIEGLRESILRKLENYLTTESSSNEIY